MDRFQGVTIMLLKVLRKTNLESNSVPHFPGRIVMFSKIVLRYQCWNTIVSNREKSGWERKRRIDVDGQSCLWKLRWMSRIKDGKA